MHRHTRLLVAWILLYGGLLAAWHFMTAYEFLPPFFFGRPIAVWQQLVDWFAGGSIWEHLWVTLIETLLAFVLGLVLGLIVGFWLGLDRSSAALMSPAIISFNSMPRVVIAPIFTLWFGLGVWSKVAFSASLVFFVIFFNVYRGVREISPVILANARMIGANGRQLLRTVYLPSAMSWVFTSLHAAVGMAFVGVVVSEYLGSRKGVGNLILQAEGVFDINGVFAGVVVLTGCAIFLDLLVSAAERRLLNWQPR
jgi:NitT/TauT family transport system permease protein